MADSPDTWVYIHWKNMYAPKALESCRHSKPNEEELLVFHMPKIGFKGVGAGRRNPTPHRSLLIVLITPGRMKYTNDSINSKDVNKRNFYHRKLLSEC